MNQGQYDAMSEIRRLANQHDLAVSVVTPDDVLLLKGVEKPTPEQVNAVVASWEWRHYGDNWADWFEGFTIDGQ
ncbi:MAG: hypothetical protein PHQ28_00720 [Mycobacterium sp.]|nr:hypothetical protein [Mycobacterium sp.]